MENKLVPENSEVSRNLFIIEAKIQNQLMDILMDTGSNRTVMSDRLAKELKLIPSNYNGSAIGVGGSVEFKGCVNVCLEIAGIQRTIQMAIARNEEVFNNTSFMALIGF